jgi:predicted Zn-dependent peptidase
VAAVAGAASAAAAAVAGKASLPEALEQTDLPNGLRIVSEAMPEARSVTLGAWVRVGGRDEPDELSGASHFLEHLLFKGTEARSARAIAEAVDAVGGEMNAFTAREHTAYYARLPHRELQLGVDLLGDVLSEPALRAEDVEAERQVIVEEILMNLDSPEDRAHTLLAQLLFPDHPLGRDVLGEMATVEGLGRDDIEGFFRRWYRPATMVIAAAGRLDHAALVDAVAAAFDGSTGGELPERRAPAEARDAVVVEQDDTEQAHLCLGWRALDVEDDQRFAMAVANQALGGGMASRLFQEVREERGLAYAVYSHPSAYSDTGSLTVYCGTAPKRAPETLRVIEGVVEDVLANGMTDSELAVAAGYLEGSLLLGLEESGGRMARLGRSLVQRGRAQPVEEQLDGIRRVTPDDVHQVLRRVFEGPRAVAAIGPLEEHVLS